MSQLVLIIVSGVLSLAILGGLSLLFLWFLLPLFEKMPRLHQCNLERIFGSRDTIIVWHRPRRVAVAKYRTSTGIIWYHYPSGKRCGWCLEDRLSDIFRVKGWDKPLEVPSSRYFLDRKQNWN